MSFVSTMPLLGEELISCHCSQEVKNFKCSSALNAYNQFMDYVDLFDDDVRIGRGFTSQSQFKKWYEKGFLSILDFLMVSGQVTWMSCEIPSIICQKMNNLMWRGCVADLMQQ